MEGLRAELADAKSARDAYGQNALDMQAQRDDEWRSLAIQFDGHRMQAMALIRAVANGKATAEDCAKFSALPPIPAHQITTELSALKAQQVGQAPAGEVHLRTGGGISLLHVELAQPLLPGTKLYTSPRPAPAQDAAGLPYQTLFNAIAAATKASAGHVEISVAEFKAALAADDVASRLNEVRP